ncbi:hypothetical protein BSKO_02334 [Bryopsis sp. KO-2023]|nr:hypothetical protein BSKO_02334 [Bryopsis sp. KO-2023]
MEEASNSKPTQDGQNGSDGEESDVPSEWRSSRGSLAELCFQQMRDNLISEWKEKSARGKKEEEALAAQKAEAERQASAIHDKEMEEISTRAKLEKFMEELRGTLNQAERIFVRALFHSLESCGLSGMVWFDWEEGYHYSPERQLKRLEALDKASAAIVVLSPAYVASREFHWEATCMRTRVIGRFGQSPFSVIPLEFAKCRIRDPHADPHDCMRLLCAPDLACQLWKTPGVKSKINKALGIIDLVTFADSAARLSLNKAQYDNFMLSSPSLVEQWIHARQQPYRFIDKPLSDWEVFDTHVWLESQGAQFRSIAEKFMSMRMDGFHLPFLTATDLKDCLGVDRPVDRSFIVEHLSKIDAQNERDELKIRRWVEVVMQDMDASMTQKDKQGVDPKPVVLLYSPDAPTGERRFVRALATSLKRAGLENELWFDWDEGEFNRPSRQLRRLQALDKARVAIIVQSPSYVACPEFHWEFTVMRTRVLGEFGAGPMTVLPIVYEPVGFPCQYADAERTSTLMLAPDFKLTLPEKGSLKEKVQTAFSGLAILLYIHEVFYRDESEVDFDHTVAIPDSTHNAFPPPYREKPLLDWSPSDVHSWLTDQGDRFHKHAENLAKMNIDGFYLPFLTAECLETHLGIQDQADRELILMGLNAHNGNQILTVDTSQDLQDIALPCPPP